MYCSKGVKNWSNYVLLGCNVIKYFLAYEFHYLHLSSKLSSNSSKIVDVYGNWTVIFLETSDLSKNSKMPPINFCDRLEVFSLKLRICRVFFSSFLYIWMNLIIAHWKLNRCTSYNLRIVKKFQMPPINVCAYVLG